MLDIIMDTLIDSIKLFPFLFLTYLAMEYMEHKMGEKTKVAIERSGYFGPVPGGILGAFPQCGFSAAASNLYAGRIITLGTLIAIFLSTSDEMLPILISEQVHISVILKLVGMKIVIGIIVGFLIDLFARKKRVHAHKEEDGHMDIGHICENENCHCEEGILKSALRHSLNIFFFILVISFVLNMVIHFVGEDFLSQLILNKPVLGQMIAGLVGLIPNCASSIVITQLYLKGMMGLGSMMAGLLAGTGVGLLVLFRVNDNLKENLKITALLYGIGVLSGIIIDLLVI